MTYHMENINDEENYNMQQKLNQLKELTNRSPPGILKETIKNESGMLQGVACVMNVIGCLTFAAMFYQSCV